MIWNGAARRIAPRYIRGLRHIEASRSRMLLAEVALDTTTRELGERLFTYHVPEELREEIFVGSQVLVPFGHQEMLAGYVVNLTDAGSLPDGGMTFKTKPVSEVLESEPLFDRTYVGLLHWISDYYAASIAEVIGAAVPADLGPRVKRIVRLLQSDAINEQSPIVAALMAAPSRTLGVRTLRQRSRLSQTQFYGALTRLRKAGILEIVREADSKASAKTVQSVLWSGVEPTTKKQLEVVSILKRSGGQMPVAALVEAVPTTHSTIKRMAENGILQVIHDEVIRDPLRNTRSSSAQPPALTDDQRKVLDILTHELQPYINESSPNNGILDPAKAPEEVPWLLHGVTGSGKTEIYLRLIEQVLQSGKAALMLVPEISLTPQLSQRLLGRFGNLVAVWHSGLSPGERYDTWRRLRAGQARVLLGARSAVLANVPNLGIIILDEEHDSSYKQSSPSPRYHAKTVAIERGRRERALVLLGSATPDVATYTACYSAKRIVELPERVFKQALPKSTLVDMREEFAIGCKGIFSRKLQSAIQGRLDKQEQIILLINRRGYASHVLCRACGFVTKCRNCSVSLVYHQTNKHKAAAVGQSNPYAVWGAAADDGDGGSLVCHHCGFTTLDWQTCPSCQSPFVKQFGLGTQRVEQEAQELFPTARLLRLDSDITSKRGAYEEVFSKFADGEADILIGTQIVAKGIDIARVSLVGVLAADSAFNLPDYRSVERGFQLLTQVSGRAGRGEYEGEVLLQTYNVDMPALALARRQDYASFLEQELESREAFEYPPFSQIIRVVLAGEIDPDVQAACEQLAEELSSHLEPFTEDQIKIVGPAPCLIERIRGKFRHHLIIKNIAGEEGRNAIASFLRTRRSTAAIQIAVDIDAVDLV